MHCSVLLWLGTGKFNLYGSGLLQWEWGDHVKNFRESCVKIYDNLPCQRPMKIYWLGLANSYIHYARQTFENFQVLPYSVDLKK